MNMNRTIKRLFTITIILFPILNQYASFLHPSIGCGDILLLLFVVMLFPIVSTKKILFTDYLFFVVYTLLITFVDTIFLKGFIMGDMIFRILRDALYGVILCFYVPHFFDILFGCKGIKVFSVICVISLVIQVIWYYIFQDILFLYLPLDFMGGINKTTLMTHAISFSKTFYYRPYSFFLEPAQVGQYLIVGLLLYIFAENNKVKRIFGSIICSIGFVLTTSASAMALLVIAWCCWLWKQRKLSNRKLRVGKLYLTCLCCGIFIASYVLVFTDLGRLLILRVSEIGIAKGNTSGNYRILRGFLIYIQLDPVRKLIGVGLGNIVSYINEYSIHLAFYEGGEMEYMNSLSYILNSTGIIGGILFLKIFISKIVQKDWFVRSLAMVIVVLLFVSSIYNSAPWLIYMSFLLCFSRRNIQKDEV